MSTGGLRIGVGVKATAVAIVGSFGGGSVSVEAGTMAGSFVGASLGVPVGSGGSLVGFLVDSAWVGAGVDKAGRVPVGAWSKAASGAEVADGIGREQATVANNLRITAAAVN